ncbi:hypothetical protein ACJ41O_013643 [Fusarium nematophilum]
MAELALAIVPLCLEALKLSKKAPGKLSIINSYMETIEEAKVTFNAQLMLFLHECKQVISNALNNNPDIDLGHLMESFEHEAWSSRELEDSLQSYLGTSLEPFKLLVQLINKRVKAVDEKLSRYDEADHEGKEGGTLAHRVGHRCKVAWDEETYEKEIDKLRKLVLDLRGLRERAATEATQKPEVPATLPAEYRTRKEDAALWLEAMTSKWSCLEVEHESHSAKLLLGSTSSRGCLDVVLHGEHTMQQVSQTSSKTYLSIPSTTHEPLCLENCLNLCGQLSDSGFYSHEWFQPTCLGFIDSRHRRFNHYPGHEIFLQNVDDSVRDPQRFWLASIVVKSALQHHNTPWWPESWTLDSLGFYEKCTGELADSLQTLHITAPLGCADGVSPRGGGGSSLHALPAEAKKAMTRFGIRNLTLWCVGVALLQTGLWRPIPWDDHEQVRDSVASLERFSKQYFEITDKLINCDFGAGARLQNPKLQNEIYRGVVCELDCIIDEFRKAGIWSS